MKFSYKNISLYTVLGGAMVLSACSKDADKIEYYQPTGPLTVSVNSLQAKTGEVLTLNFTGAADSLILWTGKEGHVYAYRNASAEDVEIPSLSFGSRWQWGAQTKALKLFVSTDFAEAYNMEGIQKATWTDISEKATLPASANATTFTSSGAIALSEYVKRGKPLYFAFRYNGLQGFAASAQPEWFIQNFEIKSTKGNGTVETLATIPTAGFKAVSIKNDNKFWSITATQLRIEGGGSTEPENEDWLITKAFHINSFSIDKGQVIKTRYDNMLKKYRLVYDEPGEYQLVIESKDKLGNIVGDVHSFNVTISE